jgi:hypothetical protein
MYEIHNCPACNSSNVKFKETTLSKFLAFRILGFINRDVPIKGMECLECSFVGSADRLTLRESKIYYTGYRDKEYTQMRLGFEPNYKEIVDVAAYREQRKPGIQKLIKQNINTEQIRTVLDYGGDDGSFIPDCFNKSEKYVFDINDVAVIPGIKKFKVDSNKSFDFIMCAHLLEHVSDLDEVLGKIKQYSNNNTWIYFEVPNNINPYIGTIHEHINFFNIESISALLKRNGFKIIDVCEYGFDLGIPAHKNNLCILTKLEKNI